MLCAIQMCMYCLADFMFHSVLVCRFNKTIISDGISDHNIYNTCHYRGRQAEENIFKNNMRKLLLTLPLLIFGFITVNAATPSVSSCPQYVDENTTLSCTCTPVDCSVRLNISWDGQLPPSRTLFLPDVRREHNGTQFTCRLDCGGQINTAAYTLQVAYGPTTDRISIQENSSIMTDGTRTLNLTCLATDIHPAPAYSWLDSLCSKNSQGSTCSFVPQRDDDGKTVICLVSNTFNYQQAEKGVSLNLTFNAALPSVSSCPRYVPENTPLSCTCTPVDCTVRWNISWDGQLPPSRTLFLPDVRRKHNGTQLTCRLDCGGQISTAAYTLQVAYGPTTDQISIEGNSSLMTDGTRELNLTCLATDLYPAPAYSWLDSLCSKNSQGNTCSFVPQRDDDGKTVICLVSNTFTYQQAEKGVSLNLTYPPVTAPKILPYSTKIVKAGDTLSCTVTGGKPLVLSVIFSCTIPHHPYQHNTKNNEFVTSYITIDTSQAPDDNMTCHCSAHWEPEPSYYTNSVTASFRTQYPAKLKVFTMNGQNTTVTVNDTANVTLLCEAHGFPSPNITLQWPHGDDLFGNLTHSDDTHSKMEHTIVAVTETHMGNYTCIANNNVGKTADTSTFTFNVNFPPRFKSSDGPGHSRDTAVNMSEQGIDLELRAYPAPDSFNFEGFKDNSDHTNEKIFSRFGMFIATASQRGPGSPEAMCHIRPGHNVQKGWLYMVTISNGFGSVQCYFSVTGVPPLPVTTTLPDSKADVGGIVGGAVGGIIAIVVVIVVVVVVWKRKYRRYEKPQPRRDQDSSPYTGLQLMQETDQRLSAHYENSPQNAQRTSSPNYANMIAETGKNQASTHYVNAQLKNSNVSSSANYANTDAHYHLAQGPGDYINLETKNNYEQLQPRRETEANVYKTLNTSR